MRICDKCKRKSAKLSLVRISLQRGTIQGDHTPQIWEYDLCPVCVDVVLGDYKNLHCGILDSRQWMIEDADEKIRKETENANRVDRKEAPLHQTEESEG